MTSHRDVRALPRAVAGGTLGLLAFGILSSLVGAVLGVAFNGAGVPLEYLRGTPFDSYVIPGLILGVAVGGTQLLGFVLLLRRAESALLAVVIAGLGMVIWIFVEMAVLGDFSFLQAIYFALGVLEVAGAVALLGAVPDLIRPWTVDTR